MIAVKDALYGTTLEGGGYDHGTVFSISKVGADDMVYSFRGGSDGEEPAASLIDVKGRSTVP